jgi:2-iminobutanoate/2-iminopropanoate deaminase
VASFAASTVVRAFSGPQADELSVACGPTGEAQGAAAQAEAVYRSLATVLAAHGASYHHLTGETLFLRDVGTELPQVLEARARVLAELGQGELAPRLSFIGQAPVDPHQRLALSAWAVVPRRADAWSVRDLRATPSCPCEGCARSGARLVLLGDQRTLRTTNLHGAGGDAYSQAREMFLEAERLLQQAGMGFQDVVRTWIHLRDIDRDYDALNRARKEFFAQRGVALRPASTGVQGAPFPAAHDVSLSLVAMQSGRGLNVTRMSTPSLNEAWSYGADFSRGLRLTEANKVMLYVSGTASIDEAGRTAHVGDFAAQAERMLHNVRSLLAAQGASFGDLVQGVSYLKHASDAPALEALYRQHGFDHFPCPTVEAGLCRSALLCEVEVAAVLPLGAVGA